MQDIAQPNIHSTVACIKCYHSSVITFSTPHNPLDFLKSEVRMYDELVNKCVLVTMNTCIGKYLSKYVKCVIHMPGLGHSIKKLD